MGILLYANRIFRNLRGFSTMITKKHQITILWAFYFIMMTMGIYFIFKEKALAGMFSFSAAVISQVNILLIKRSAS